MPVTHRNVATTRAAIVIVVTAALIGVVGINPTALAQQAKSASIPTDDLFWPDTNDFRPGAGSVERLVNFVKQAQSPGSQCPTDVDFTVFESAGDPLWASAMANWRREAIEGVLRGFGPSVRVTGTSTGGIISAVIITAQSAKDKEKPKLDTNSVPRKGKKVKAGDKITVTMVARDHANLWQSGIKTIQLVAESEGGRFVASENFPPASPGCTALPPERRVEATYVVPSNPPPIVRLAALAEDHAGLMDIDIGEFPTQGDWYGTLEFSSDSVVSGVRTTIKDHMDIVLEYDGKGNLEGTLTGNRSFNQQGSPNCNWATTIPNKLRGKLLGSYTPGAEVMSIQLVEPVDAPMTKKDCPGGGYIISGYGIHEWPPFKSVLRSPRAAGDGTFRSSFEETTGPVTNRISLTLRPVQN